MTAGPEADCGLAEGRTFAELEASSRTSPPRLARGATDIDWPGGETAAALAERVAGRLARCDPGEPSGR